MYPSYKKWGFSDSPFKTTPLQANEKDKNLLIGRDKELTRLEILLSKADKWTVIDGGIGSGKTSLANVATFNAYNNFLTKKTDILLIPATRTIQIDESTNVEEFCKTIYTIAAESILNKKTELSNHLLSYRLNNIDEIAAIIKNPTFTARGASIAGNGYSSGSTANDSAAFETSGFNSLIQSWLTELFGDTTSTNGGVVIIIDNLELLKTCKATREILEKLRDPIMTQIGIKWVLCGANGIISATASPRINGHLQKALKVEKLPTTKADEILSSRKNAFSEIPSPYLPLTTKNFHTLHEILGRNLRDLLGKIDSYNEEIMQLDEESPNSDDEKDIKFQEWLKEESHEARELAERYSGQKTWELLLKAKEEGSFSSNEYEKYGFTQSSNFSTAIQNLASLGLVDIVTDDDDKRRKNISLTSKAYYALYHSK
jgi:hypothetical protein